MPPERPEQPAVEPERVRLGKEYGRLAGVGMQFGITIVVLALGGYWLDQQFGTYPLLLIVGVFLGFVGGTISLVKRVGSPSKRRKPPATP